MSRGADGVVGHGAGGATEGWAMARAAVVVEPGRLCVRSIRVAPPGDYEARCTMLFGTTCAGTDSHVVEGTFAFPIGYPVVLGHESVGRVVQVGAKVRHLRVGDLVTRVGAPPADGVGRAWGGFATLGVAHDHRAMLEDGLPAESADPFRAELVVPEDVDPAVACLVVNWRETLSYVERIGVGGASVLVVGSGGPGLSLARMAVLSGARSVTMVGSAARRHLGEAVGAERYLDYREGTRSPAGPGGERFDVVIDAVGRSDVVNACLPLLAPGGTLGVYGLDEWGALAVDLSLAPGTFTFYNGGYDEPEAHESVVELVRGGLLDPDVWYEGWPPFELERISAALDAVRARSVVKALVSLQGREPGSDR